MSVYWLLLLIGALSTVGACNDDKNGKAEDTDSDSDSDSTGTAIDTEIVDVAYPKENTTGTIRVNHFGWRPDDDKVAVVLELADATVELRRYDDDSVVERYLTGGLETDEDSQDSFATVDFSEQTSPGTYYLYLSDTDEASYPFEIRDGVYDIVGRAAMKSFYYQRCNHDRERPYASDVMPKYEGIGGEWVDGICHTGDAEAPAGPDSEDHGPLDVTGGWHDAGDYQKTLWGRGVSEMLFAYELNPEVWKDGDLNIPESGNGVPDILDELQWELDFYGRMQRDDGHFMSSVKGNGGEISSPPSESDQSRVYFDGTSPSGNGWSGGGVTVETATGNGVLALAHAAMLFDAVGQNDTAARYKEAALAGWEWLNDTTLSDAGERRIKATAAAAVHRMDSSVSSAAAFVGAFSWADWDGDLPWSVTPQGDVLTAGLFHILLNDASDDAVAADAKEAVGEAIVNRAFEQEGIYGGMFGGPGNGWDWSWGSNRANSLYGANLFIADRLGIEGDHDSAEIVRHAKRFFHYMLGRNPLNMVYLSNMAAYGGEHSSFQIYHGWFSATGGDGDNGNDQYNGKPDGAFDPLYPYYPDDDQTSTYGPAPGLVPGGPNFYYSGSYEIPNKANPSYAYRDWSVGCDWDGSACASASWEITEPSNGYQGAFVLLASFMMSE